MRDIVTGMSGVSRIDTRWLDGDGRAGIGTSDFPGNHSCAWRYTKSADLIGYPDPAAVGQRSSRQAYQSRVSAALHADLPLSKVQRVSLMFSNELQCYFSFSIFFHVLSLNLQIALPPLVPRARADKPTSKLCSLTIGSESRNGGDAECRLRLIYHVKAGVIGG